MEAGAPSQIDTEGAGPTPSGNLLPAYPERAVGQAHSKNFPESFCDLNWLLQ